MRSATALWYQGVIAKRIRDEFYPQANGISRRAGAVSRSRFFRVYVERGKQIRICQAFTLTDCPGVPDGVEAGVAGAGVAVVVEGLETVWFDPDAGAEDCCGPEAADCCAIG
jgi:hypothetical protein